MQIMHGLLVCYKSKSTKEEFRKSFIFGMQSSKMSLNSNKIKSQFSFSLHAQFVELYPTETPIKIKYTVPEMYKTIKYKGN